MKRFRDSYGSVLEEYFYGFWRGWRGQEMIIVLIFLVGFLNWKLFDKTNIGAGIPVLFALVSGASHSLRLPFPMYLAPFSHKQREEFLQKSLHVKIVVPLIFALGCDLVLLFIRPVSLYVLILQLTAVFVVAFICGTLHDMGFNGSTWEYAYGDFAPFTEVSLVICYMDGSILTLICMGTVNAVEFWIVLGVAALLTAPVLNGIRKHWKEIRKNFAEYETAVKTKELVSR